MARLPFGQNSFADFLPTPSATINPHSTASFLSRQTFPPPITDKRDKFHQKRKYAGDVSKQHPKRNKSIMVEDVVMQNQLLHILVLSFWRIILKMM